MNVICFVAGAIIGAMFGVFCMALMVIRRSDED